MALHNKLGKDAEDLAEAWLKQNGYDVLHRNWRYSHYEIDIVATRNKMLHIVEVKARWHSPFGGYPEESVTRKKFKNLQKAVDEFLFLNPGYKWIQYSILSITLHKDKEPEYFLIEDVYL